MIKNSELVLNDDNSIYHLKLKPEHIAKTIYIVGDQNRVFEVSKYFDSIEHKVSNREFVTHTGYIGKKRVSVLSTGIGSDNIDIVMNELDALVNIDFKSRTIKKKHTALEIIRLGTCGSIQKNIEINSLLVSSHGLGIDNLMHFYNNTNLNNSINNAIKEYIKWPENLSTPYIFDADPHLLKKFNHLKKGITVTAPGFYGPQARTIRLPYAITDLKKQLTNFEYNGLKICNFEMETAALYGFGFLMKHSCLTICCVLANRFSKTYSKNPKKAIENMITTTLNKM